MSNYIYDGFYFDELNSEFKLQNTTTINVEETQQMNLPILNNQGNGYVINVSTSYGENADFTLYKKIDTNLISLVNYDGTNDVFKFNKNIDLQNSTKIINSLDPTNSQDIVTKGFLENSISGFSDGTVKSISINTTTNGLTITGSPITTSGTININLSTQLQKFSVIGPGVNGQVLTSGINETLNWTYPGTVKSINITTGQGISATGGPIVESGSINLSLDAKLQSLSELTSDGIICKNNNTLTTNAIPTTNGLVPITNNSSLNWISYQTSGLPIGSIIMWGTEIKPDNTWLALEGQEISRTTYDTLFSIYGTIWGSGNGLTTFNLPDTRGLFPRGWNHGTTKANPYNDPDASSRIASNTGGVTGDRVGTLQSDIYEQHSHSYLQPGSSITVNGVGTVNVPNIRSTTNTGNSPTSGGNETRPVNFSIMFIIKAL